MTLAISRPPFVLLRLEAPHGPFVLRPDEILSGRGWAIAEFEILEVVVTLNGAFLCYATHGLARPDIALLYPDYPGADHAGFSFSVRLPHRTGPGLRCELAVTVHTAGGGEKHEFVHAVWPDGAVVATGAVHRWPLRIGLDSARLDEHGQLRLRGWVLSAQPLQELCLFLGERELEAPQTCLPRPDLAVAYPDYPNAADAGFFLAQAVGPFGRARPLIRVRATSESGQRRQILAPLDRAATPARILDRRCWQICIDHLSVTPDGAVSMAGWAVGAAELQAVTVALDGVPIGEAETGLSRPDIGNRFPDLPAARHSGFRFSARLDRAILGGQTVTLDIRGSDGSSETLVLPAPAEPPTVADQLVAAKKSISFGIDGPTLVGDRATAPALAMLTLTGWAIAHAGVTAIEVWFDGRLVGPATLGLRREDIAAAHPDRDDALLCGFAMAVPQRLMTPGEHGVIVVIRTGDSQSAERSFDVLVENLPQIGAIRTRLPAVEIDQRLRILLRCGCRPTFLLIIRGADGLAETLESLRAQAYPDWQALVVGAAPRKLDAEMAERVRFVRSVRAAWSQGAPFCSVIAAGDRLGADALLTIAVESSLDATAEFFYADEIRHDAAAGVVRAMYKPAWSPALLLSTNYIGRFWCATADLMARAGLNARTIRTAGDYDLVLRLTEVARSIRHVPLVLSMQGDFSPPDQAPLRAAIIRRGLGATVAAGLTPDTWRVECSMAAPGLVSVIMPTRAARGLVEAAIRSVRAHTPDGTVEIICPENIHPDQPQWKAWLGIHADVVLELAEDFNWSRFNNLGAAAAQGEFLLFMNDDVEAIEPGWLEAMLAHAAQPDVGVVGPLLLYPDGRVQHAGMFLAGNHGIHAFRFAPADEPGPFGLARVTREVTAVTGACMLMRRDVFDRLGGFDEAHGIIKNDLDFCLRAGEAGLRVVFTPHACLTHHELASRAAMADSFDEAKFSRRWRTRFLRGDRLYNPNLAEGSAAYVPEPEPVELVYAAQPLIAAESIRRILVIKLDHIGDFLLAMPAIRRLKQHFPAAEITVLAAAAPLSLASLEPAIDQVIEFNFFHAESALGTLPYDEAATARLRAHLAAQRFDLAVDMRMHSDTRHLLQLSGATWLAGFDSGGRFGWLDIAVEWEVDRHRQPKRSHAASNLVLLADAVGNASGSTATALLPCLAAGGKRLVCVHPGAGNPIKQWPASSYAGLIDLLVADFDVDVLLIGNAGEAAVARDVMDHTAHAERVRSIAGDVALADLPGVLLGCALFVGNDSGPKHLAASLGVPTVGVHSANIDAAEWAPLGPDAVAIRRLVVCGPCYLEHQSDCHRGLACLSGIRPQDVFRACRAVLGVRSAHHLVMESEQFARN
jgi:ADP-heptose:LPS heptosyltransferase/GT2 family glycosyltransferase